MKKEIWKSIKGYEASNFGRVRSLDHWRDNGAGGYMQKGRILKPGKNSSGYLQVTLCKDGKRKIFYVHRLVWEAFNGKIPEGMEVNHINEDKTDNRYPENLNLLTHGDNIRYGTANQKRAEKLSGSVLQLTLDDVLVKEWPSMREAERNGYNHNGISACCLGKLKTYMGFKWVKKLPLG